jgi:hypothetical protein
VAITLWPPGRRNSDWIFGEFPALALLVLYASTSKVKIVKAASLGNDSVDKYTYLSTLIFGALLLSTKPLLLAVSYAPVLILLSPYVIGRSLEIFLNNK